MQPHSNSNDNNNNHHNQRRRHGYLGKSTIFHVTYTTVLVRAVRCKGSDATEFRRGLEALGMNVVAQHGHAVDGYMLITSLPQLDSVAGLFHAFPAARSRKWGGSVSSEAVEPLAAQIASSRFLVNGTGVTVGIISDSFSCVGGGMSQSISTGDLPPAQRIRILKDGCSESSPSDEGRALAEVMYDIAPGVNFLFYSASTSLDLATGTKLLVQAGADIIVDDLTFFDEAIFSVDIGSFAYQEAVQADKVTVFSAAGNIADNAWDDTYDSSHQTINYTLPGTNTTKSGFRHSRMLNVSIAAGSIVVVILGWNDSYSVNTGIPPVTDLDIIYRFQGNASIVASSVDHGTAQEIIEIFSVGQSFWQFSVSWVSGPSSVVFKLIFLTNGNVVSTFPHVSGSTIWGHHNNPYVISVGAASFCTIETGKATPEPYSSFGSTPLYFDFEGDLIARSKSSSSFLKPDILSFDGISTSFYGTNCTVSGSCPCTNSASAFFGTSCAVANAAGVAALMVERSRKC